ncbi:MAG: cation:proton antiporter [Myxococcota bacterium]|nr:cation:proton antiporter [Myxococcota bacterium]
MKIDQWLVIASVALTVVTVGAALLRKLPITVAMLYLGLGVALGPAALGALTIDPWEDRVALHRVAELAVVIALFASGLRLRSPLRHPSWKQAALLAGPVMIVTIALTAAFAHLVLGVSIALAIVIAAALAPTDPVLAAEVAVRHASDPDRLRLSLTGEAGLNDGAAFPFVVLGLDLLREGGLGPWLADWALHRLLWAVPGGLVVGLAVGYAIGRIAIVVRTRAGDAQGVDALLAIATAGLAYAAADGLETWAFLAAFGAGLGFRRAEMHVTEAASPPPIATDAAPPDGGPAETVLERELHEAAERHPTVAAGGILRDASATCEALERGVEFLAVVAIGALLWPIFDVRGLALAAFIFLVARPLGALLFSHPRTGGRWYRGLLGWLGVRGVGSLYYSEWAFENGLGEADAHLVSGLVLTVVAASIVTHGATATPLVRAYERRLPATDPSSRDRDPERPTVPP